MKTNWFSIKQTNSYKIYLNSYATLKLIQRFLQSRTNFFTYNFLIIFFFKVTIYYWSYNKDKIIFELIYIIMKKNEIEILINKKRKKAFKIKIELFFFSCSSRWEKNCREKVYKLKKIIHTISHRRFIFRWNSLNKYENWTFKKT